MRGFFKLIRGVWANASLRSKSLAVMSIPVLAIVLTSTLFHVVNLSYDSADANHRRLVVLLTIELGGMVIGLTVVLLFSRQIINQFSRLAENAHRLAKQRPLLPMDVGEDEIGALSKALAETAAMLAERDRRLNLALAGSGAVIWEVNLATGGLEVTGNVEGLAKAGLTSDALPRSLDAWIAMVAPESRPEVAKAVGDARHEGASFHVEYPLRLPNGQERWLESRGQTFIGPDALPKLLGVVLDVTDRRQNELALRDREATLASVFAASPDLITILDLDGRVRVSSPVIRRLLGYDPEERAGAFAPDLVHPDDREQLMAALKAVRESTEPVFVEFRYRHADGRWVTLSVHGQALTDVDGKATGIVTVTRDKTEMMRLEQALQQSKEAAEQASRAKSEFLSRMSHELRTPLNAVLGFAQILEMTTLSADQQEATQHILKAGKHLLRLINEVLDIARIEAGQFTVSVEPIRLMQVVQDSCDLIAPLTQNYGVTLITSAVSTCDCHILADEHRLRQVLLNLLSNAVKYNRGGGTVTISCLRCPQNRQRIAVTDTGPGIPPELQSLLFVPFERLGADRTGIEGHGIGLALSKRLIELMGGEIGMESTPGQGSTFWVELPRAEGPMAHLPALGDDQAVAPGLTSNETMVLYIEDNLSNLRLMERVLAMTSNVRLVTAMQGRLGFDLAKEHFPDLILMDLHLPDLSGVELLHRLKANPATQTIPVVVISADATPSQIERLKVLGASAYLTKPLDIQLFLTTMEEVLTKKGD